MAFKWIVFVVTAWIVVSLLVGVVENVVIGGAIDPETGEPIQISVLNDLMNSPVITNQSFGAKVSALFSDDKFWIAVGAMITFRFPAIFYGAWATLQWVFFLPFCVAFIIMMGGYMAAHIPLVGRGT